MPNGALAYFEIAHANRVDNPIRGSIAPAKVAPDIVDGNNFTLPINDGDLFAQGIQHRHVEIMAVLECHLRGITTSNVTEYQRIAQQHTFSGPDRRNSQRYVDTLAVFFLTHGFHIEHTIALQSQIAIED